MFLDNLMRANKAKNVCLFVMFYYYFI